MTISRFSSLSLLVLASCGDPAANVPSVPAQAPAPGLVIEAAGRAYSINDLMAARRHNPNRFELLVHDYTVRAPIAEVPRFEQSIHGSGYGIPLIVHPLGPDPELERDFRAMSPAQLYGKYGQAADQMISAQSENDARRRRGEPEMSFAELSPFTATTVLENYTLEKAARLDRGQDLVVRCRDMRLSPRSVVFLGCSDQSRAATKGT